VYPNPFGLVQFRLSVIIKVYNLTFDGGLDFDVNPTFVSRETHSRELARSLVLPGDVLMNIVGPPLGKVSIIPGTYPEWNINQAIARFRVIPGFDNRFLSYCLRSELVLGWAKRRAKATAGQFNLTLQICRELPLPVPPTAEQQRIVAEVERRLSVVEELDRSVAANLKRAGRLRQAVLKRAFEGKLVPQDPADEPAAALLERIQAGRQERPRPVQARQKPARQGKRGREKGSGTQLRLL
jgi:type I restriction enzyme S subunit